MVYYSLKAPPSGELSALLTEGVMWYNPRLFGKQILNEVKINGII